MYKNNLFNLQRIILNNSCLNPYCNGRDNRISDTFSVLLFGTVSEVLN
jgi:hypothetical protein